MDDLIKKLRKAHDNILNARTYGTTEHLAGWEHLTADEAADRIEALQEKVQRAERAMRNIKPYLEWTVSDESPGHHPTMPSAVGAFLDSLAQLRSPDHG